MKQSEIFNAELETVSDYELKYSSGFPSSKPERWVPTISGLWLPFLNVLQVDFKLLSIKPSFDYKASYDQYCIGGIGSSQFALAMESGTASYLASLIADTSNQEIADIALEYLVCRFFSTISQSWSGNRFADLKFLKSSSHLSFSPIACIKIETSINARHCTFEILLDESLVAKLDGLWSRQTSTIQYGGTESESCYLRFGYLEDPSPNLESGTVLPLGASFNFDYLNLIKKEEKLSCRLCQYQNQLVIKINPVALREVASQSSLEISSPAFDVSPEKSTLLNRAGFLLPLGFDYSMPVLLKVDKEVIAEANFVIQEGQLGLEIK